MTLPSPAPLPVPERAMVIVAPPDDAEFMCAGTVARWTRAGTHVLYVVVTKGDKGSDDPAMTPERLARIREEEQRAAAAILGVEDVVFLGYPDAYLQYTLDLRRDLVRMIRRYRPDVVVTFDPTTRFFRDAYTNHPDHRVTGDAAVDAVYPAARDRLTFAELLAEGLEPHKVRELWLGTTHEPNFWVDIGSVLDVKRRALLAHPSQLDEGVAGFVTMLARESARGQPFEYAEAFRRIVIEQPAIEARPAP